MKSITINKCKIAIMEADKVSDSFVGLPPGNPLDIYPLHAFKEHPNHWIRDNGFICKVNPDKGLWFDWRNNRTEDSNTAVIPSVKGMNPITGQKIESIYLEKYSKNCPVHNIPFTTSLNGETRFCTECKYAWPVQNFVAAPNYLWWDGFRNSDGTVRQFFFTDDEKRDIPSLVMGNNTVPAFGFIFYKTKISKGSYIGIDYNVAVSPQTASPTYQFYNSSIDCDSFGSGGYGSGCSVYSSCSTMRSSKLPNSFVSVKKDVSVGAGAKIKQDLRETVYSMDDWKEEPELTTHIYFVFENEFNTILNQNGGKINIARQEGFLQGLPVG